MNDRPTQTAIDRVRVVPSKCVTHHYACDCREEQFARMRAALKVAKVNLEEGTYTEAAKDIITAALATSS
jgi:hypothetical protein